VFSGTTFTTFSLLFLFLRTKELVHSVPRFLRIPVEFSLSYANPTCCSVTSVLTNLSGDAEVPVFISGSPIARFFLGPFSSREPWFFLRLHLCGISFQPTPTAPLGFFAVPFPPLPSPSHPHSLLPSPPPLTSPPLPSHHPPLYNSPHPPSPPLPLLTPPPHHHLIMHSRPRLLPFNPPVPPSFTPLPLSLSPSSSQHPPSPSPLPPLPSPFPTPSLPLTTLPPPSPSPLPPPTIFSSLPSFFFWLTAPTPIVWLGIPMPVAHKIPLHVFVLHRPTYVVRTGPVSRLSPLCFFPA